MLTTDPKYWKGYQPKIEVKNLGNSSTYYTFDPFNDVTTNKVVYARVDLGMDHHGTFEIQIENANQGVDDVNIKNGQRVFMNLKKDASLSYNLVLSGLIRKTGTTRGRGGEALYNIVGSSTAIRLNEIVLNVDTHPAILGDGMTIDITDTNFKADNLLQAQLAGVTADGVITAANLAANSDVETFIPSFKVNFGEAQDGCNLIENITNAEVFTGTDDIIVLRSRLQPFAAGRGFVLKDIQGTQDDADITGYIDGTPEYFESCYKSDGYANQNYGILPGTSEDGVDRGVYTTGVSDNGIYEYAVSFKPTHSVFKAGDIFIGAFYVDSGGTGTGVPVYFRLCKDASGVPQNVSGVFANLLFPPDAFGEPDPGTHASPVTVSNNYKMYDDSLGEIESVILDTTHNYWLIFADYADTSGPSHYTAWAGNNFYGSITGKRHTTSFSTWSDGGGSWVNQAFTLPRFSMPIRRAIGFACADPKGIAAVGSGLGTPGGNTISSVQSDLPASVKGKAQIQKYLVNQMYASAKPQIRWNNLVISSPNIPILPNDPLLIVDSTLGFSSAGAPAHVATTGNMSYEFGERGGDGNNLVSSMNLRIEPVGYATHY